MPQISYEFNKPSCLQLMALQIASCIAANSSLNFPHCVTQILRTFPWLSFCPGKYKLSKLTHTSFPCGRRCLCLIRLAVFGGRMSNRRLTWRSTCKVIAVDLKMSKENRAEKKNKKKINNRQNRLLLIPGSFTHNSTLKFENIRRHPRQQYSLKHSSGACAHYVMVSKFQRQPFWLATQLCPHNDWTGWQNRPYP